MNRVTNEKSMTVHIWQQKLNKSDIAQQDLINSTNINAYDILILQEPYIDFLGNTHANQKWYPVLPHDHRDNPKKSWSAIFINKCILSSTWQQIKVKSQDIVSVSINTKTGPITIFNIYNNKSHSDSLQAIWTILEGDAWNLKLIHTAKMIWAGDFNHHHPLWDEECNAHLFTTHNLNTAQTLIDLLAYYSMTMML